MGLDLVMVEAFARPRVRPRWRSLLASERGREKFRAHLAHDFEDELDPSVAVLLPGRLHSSEAVQRLVASLCDAKSCQIVSESRQLDGREMPLAIALSEILGTGIASILSIIPGVLAYFEPENGRDNRWLLVADAGMRAKLAAHLGA